MKIIWHKRKDAVPERESYNERKGCAVSVNVVNTRGEPMDTSFDLVAYVEEVHALIRE